MTLESAIVQRLVDRGRDFLSAPPAPVDYTPGDPEANALVNDLQDHPHAFVIACVMDRQIKAERAWQIPHRLRQRLGTFEFDELKRLSRQHVADAMTKPDPLHRYVNRMSENLFAAIQRIANIHDGQADLIWEGKPKSAEVIYRFLGFRGIGPKIASMAVNLLARNHKIPFGDYYSVDISVDVHVRRVFGRLGLTPPEASTEELQYRTRALNPDFPGLLDRPIWHLGREWCRPKRPQCDKCYMNDLCPGREQT